MSDADRAGEPPVYRPFALLAFGATLVGGTPLGVWLASWLHLGAPPVAAEWRLLHAHLQIVGFFGTLIVGMAHHLLPRFAGRAVARGPLARWLFAALAIALVLRVAAAGAGPPAAALVAALLQAAAFLAFAGWVWRTLDPPSLALLRRHLTVSTGWLAAACLVEALLRGRALRAGLAVGDLAGLRAVHAMALLGGAVGWVMGVLLRAGPMFVPDWNVPAAVARAGPWILGLGVVVTVSGELGPWAPPAAGALARLGEGIALGAVSAVILAGGGLRRAPRALPMLSRSADEARLLRLAMVSAVVAAPGWMAAAVVAWTGLAAPLLSDALRHLVAVGFLTSVVAAMTFRLIPVLESTALPWPGLRRPVCWALGAAVALRTAEVVVGAGWSGPAPWVPLSGVLVAAAVAGVSANLLGAIAGHRSPAGPAGRGVQ